jgi:hypothetical protein
MAHFLRTVEASLGECCKSSVKEEVTMVTWKQWKTRLENIYAAVAYADANDHHTARRLAPFSTTSRIRSWVNSLSDIFTAVAFAEADMPKTALAFLGKVPAPRRAHTLESFTEAVGLRGVRFVYGVASV